MRTIYGHYDRAGRKCQVKAIKIKAHRVDSRLIGTVRIDAAAETKLRQLCRESGLSARYLASQIIIQGADFVQFLEEDAE